MNIPLYEISAVFGHELLKGDCDCSKILLKNPSGENYSVEVNSERISWHPAVVNSDCALCSLGCVCENILMGEAMLSFRRWSCLSSDDVAIPQALWKSWSGSESIGNTLVSEFWWLIASVIEELNARYYLRILRRHYSTLSKLKGNS